MRVSVRRKEKKKKKKKKQHARPSFFLTSFGRSAYPHSREYLNREIGKFLFLLFFLPVKKKKEDEESIESSMRTS